MKILAIKDGRSKAIFAHGVPVKGVDEGRYVVDTIVDECNRLGYSRLVLKSDNEPASCQLVSEAPRALRVEGNVFQAAEEKAIPHDPVTNGGS